MITGLMSESTKPSSLIAKWRAYHAGKPSWRLWALLLPLVTANSASASCSSTPWSAIQPYMERFVLNPATTLYEFPNGGDKLSYVLKDYLMADSRLVLKSVTGLIKIGNPAQKKSIGRALGSSVNGCKLTDPDAAKLIQATVEKLHDQTVSLAYALSLLDDDDSATATNSLIGKSANIGPSLEETSDPAQHIGATAGKLQIWDPSRQQRNVLAPLKSYSR
jgi:hypothetical protein